MRHSFTFAAALLAIFGLIALLPPAPADASENGGNIVVAQNQGQGQNQMPGQGQGQDQGQGQMPGQDQGQGQGQGGQGQGGLGQGPAGEYFVIMGSFSLGNQGPAQQRLAQMQGCGFPDAYVANTNEYPNLRNGLLIVVVGPYAYSYAQQLVNQARSCVPDSYVKSGW